ncbi:MAG: hypothetical protein Q3M24_13145 [Candidatus Electrothrix aestuarii]|uniref:Uncharacterized protein n=1 Tax=Candidatus Electrothrix aestuarii TaxID=3062594 RepID=A0AAU8LQR8_9BACT
MSRSMLYSGPFRWHRPLWDRRCWDLVILAAEIFTKAHDVRGQLGLLDFDQNQLAAAVLLADHSGEIDAEDGEVQADFFLNSVGLNSRVSIS